MIGTHTEIIKRVSLNLGIPEKEVELVYKGAMYYIKHLITKTSCVAIRLPHVGCMYASIIGLNSSITYYKNRGREDKIPILEKKVKVIEEFQKTQLPGDKISKHFRRPRWYSTLFTGGNPIWKIEQRQNEGEK